MYLLVNDPVLNRQRRTYFLNMFTDARENYCKMQQKIHSPILVRADI